VTAFQSWLQELSLDADRTDLCPNLAYIPLSQLRRLWREGCAPSAEAISAHQWKKRAPRPARPLAGISTERLIGEAQRRGMVIQPARAAVPPESRHAQGTSPAA
jgi:hypothetical protein